MKVLSVLVSGVISGCASSPTAFDAGEVFASQGSFDHPVYGYLSEDSNGDYAFTKFAVSQNHIDSGEPWVNLANLQPMWNVHTPSSCYETATLQPEICSEDRESLFIESEVDVSQLPKMAGVAVFTMGLSLIAGLPKETIFQRDDFIGAVDEALAKIQNYKKKVSAINRSFAGHNKLHTSNDLPAIRYNVIDKTPSYANGALQWMDLKADEFAPTFPDVFIEPLSFSETLTKVNSGYSFASLDQLVLVSNQVLTKEFAYSVTCTRPATPLKIEFDCPETVAANVGEVVIDFTVTSARISKAEIGSIDPVSSGGLSLEFKPARPDPWRIVNENSYPMQLRGLLIDYGGKSVSVDLSALNIVEPGKRAEFSIDRYSYSMLQPSITVGERASTRRYNWTIEVYYLPQGFDKQVARFTGSHTPNEIASTTAALESLSGNIFAPKLEERLNDR